MIARLILTVEVESEDDGIIWGTDVANALNSMCVEGDLGSVEFIDDEGNFVDDDDDEDCY